jgi:type II secretory ATPase GspE/PulE/Tfp pilus assembly ATPase PilB-like protein
LYSRDLEKIRETALKNGLKTLAVDGIEKVRAGLTTLEELQIILGDEVNL